MMVKKIICNPCCRTLAVAAALTEKAAILAAVVAVAAGASLPAFAGANLIKNGTFEGTATKNSWGSYANQVGFSCSDWTFDQPGRAGLGKPDGTWMAKNLAVGSSGLFMQTGSGEVTVRQSLGALPAGTYRVSLSYTARPSHTGATTYIELVEAGGAVTSVRSLSPTATTLQSFSADVDIPAGTYTFRFRQPDPSGDKANCFENVVVRRIEATIGENVYYSIEDAMTAVSAGSNIVWTTDAPNLVLSNTNLVWNGNMPTVNVPGTLTISGANTIATYGT